MIDSGIFKQLKFTQGGQQQETEHSWLRKLEAIEAYSKTTKITKTKSFAKLEDDQHLEIPQDAANTVLRHRLRFKLEFDSTLYDTQAILTTSCCLHLYEQVSDLMLYPIHSRETLDVLYLESNREARFLSDLDGTWLDRLKPYFFTHPNGELQILIPAELEMVVLKALCLQGVLFYFDPEPKYYYWVEALHSAHFIPQLQETDEGWKLWGKFVDAQENCIDLWEIQAVTLGGIARQNNQLFEYTRSAYPWIETLLTGGAIRCTESSLREFLYRLLCLFDQRVIEWPVNMTIESIVVSPQPIFYVKTKDDKKRFKTNIEGFAWFRTHNVEYPSEIHQASGTPSRPKVFRVDCVHDQNQCQVSIQIPDLITEEARLKEIDSCAGLAWNAFRSSFHVELSHAIEIFYYLLNRGWEVWAENLQIKILQEIEIQLTTHPNWFEVDLMAGKPATKISAWQLIHMLKKRRMFIQLSDGSLGILPERWFKNLHDSLHSVVPIHQKTKKTV